MFPPVFDALKMEEGSASAGIIWWEKKSDATHWCNHIFLDDLPRPQGKLLSIFVTWSLQLLTLNTKKPMVLPARCSSYSLSHDWATIATALREYVLYVLVWRMVETEIFWLEPGYVKRTGMAWTWSGIIQTCLGSGSNPGWLELQVEEEWKFEMEEWGHSKEGFKARF